MRKLNLENMVDLVVQTILLLLLFISVYCVIEKDYSGFTV